LSILAEMLVMDGRFARVDGFCPPSLHVKSCFATYRVGYNAIICLCLLKPLTSLTFMVSVNLMKFVIF